METKGLRLNFATLKELTIYYLNKDDVQRVEEIFVLIKESDMVLLNRHVLDAILKISTSTTKTETLPFLHHLTPNDEFKRAITDIIPKFVISNRSALLPKILGAVNHCTESSAEKLFKEMAEQGVSAKQFDRTWYNFKQIGFDIRSNISAYTPALHGQSSDLIKKILGAMHADPTVQLRQSHFRQLLKLEANRSVVDLINTIHLMCVIYKTRPHRDFIVSDILPLMRQTMTYPNALSKLQRTKLRIIDSIVACIIGALSENDMSTAHQIASNNAAYLAESYVIQPLQMAYRNTNDVDQFVRIVHLVADRITAENLYYVNGRRSKYTDSDVEEARDEFLGRIIRTTMRDQMPNIAENIRLLNGFLQLGLTISAKQSDGIRRALKIERDSEMGKLLDDLNVVTEKRVKPEALNIAQCIREKNMDAIEAILANNDVVISNAQYALLIEHHCREKQLELALSLFDRAIESNDQFQLDVLKVFHIIDLMIEQNRIDAEKIETMLDHILPSASNHPHAILKTVLHKLANDGYVELVKKITNFCIEAGYEQPSNTLLGPSISAQLKRNGFEAAVDAYEYCAKTYKMTPTTMKLMKALIENKMNDLIMRTFNTYRKIHSDKAAVIRLASAYSECGEYEKANELFRNECMTNLAGVVAELCNTFARNDQMFALESLLYSTKGLKCKRNDIYQNLFNIYCKKKMVDKVLALQRYAKEDVDVTHKQEYWKRMEEFLRENNAQVID